MSKELLIWLVFGGFFVGPVLMAVTFGWVARQWHLRQPAPARRHWRKRPPTTLEELKCMAEYQRRWRRALTRSWIAWFAALILLLLFQLPLTAATLALGMPFLALVEHLRCPACDSTATLRGLTEGSHCRRCGVKLKA